MPSTGSADFDRRTWIIEQIAYPPLPPIVEEMKNQVSFQSASYRDAVSAQGSLLANAKWVEIGGKFSKRFFADLSDEGKSYHNNPENQASLLTAEIARSYVSRHGHYGRIGIEYVHFLPESPAASPYRLLRIGFNTGILETADSPYFIRINVSTFRKLRGQYWDSHVVYAGGEIGKQLPSGRNHWRIGGFLSWTYRTNRTEELVSTVGRYEHMLFSLGPFAEYVTGALHVRLSVPFRLWLDREIVGVTNPNDPTNMIYFSSYPNVMRAPDLSLVMTLVL